jgi:hypothetical protein
VADKEEFSRLARRTALMSLAFAAALVFGIILLAGGDWIPGTIIVVAAIVGVAVQIPAIRKLCSEGPAPSPRPPSGRARESDLPDTMPRPQP